MTYKGIVVVPAYQLEADNFWDVRKVLVIEYLLNLFLAFRQSLWPQLFCLFVIIL